MCTLDSHYFHHLGANAAPPPGAAGTLSRPTRAEGPSSSPPDYASSFLEAVSALLGAPVILAPLNSLL